MNVKGAGEGQTVEAVALADGKEVGRTSGKPGEALAIAMPNPKLWWPASPFLYDLKVTLTDKEHAGGASGSIRSTAISACGRYPSGPDETGHARILLNNKPVFQNGFLDQGFWPDGIYTAPTDDALKYDLQMLEEVRLQHGSQAYQSRAGSLVLLGRQARRAGLARYARGGGNEVIRRIRDRSPTARATTNRNCGA